MCGAEGVKQVYAGCSTGGKGHVCHYKHGKLM